MILTAPTMLTLPKWRLFDHLGLRTASSGHLAKNPTSGHLAVGCDEEPPPPSGDPCTDLETVDISISVDSFFCCRIAGGGDYTRIEGTDLDGSYNIGQSSSPPDCIYTASFFLEGDLPFSVLYENSDCTDPFLSFSLNTMGVRVDVGIDDIIQGVSVTLRFGIGEPGVIFSYSKPSPPSTDYTYGDSIPNIGCSAFVATDSSSSVIITVP